MAKKEIKGSRKKIYILIALIIVLAILIPRITSNSKINEIKEKTIPEAVKLAINNPETKFTIGEVKEKSGVYEFKLSIGEGEQAQEYTSFISKDGKILFTSGIELEELKASTTTTTKKASCEELTKTDKPDLMAFVVSNCPFGLQMQRLYNKTISELPEIANNLSVKYMGSIEDGKITSMHGDEEAQENLRQICIREEQKDKFWPYLSCYMKAEGLSQTCLNQVGVNQATLNTCMTDSNKGLKYAKADFDLAAKFNVTGSPTLVLNNKETVSEFDFGGRVADAIKQIVCCGSKTKAEFCNKELSKDEMASSFSETETVSVEGASASCE